jgi:hypothetical protein
LTTCEQRNAIVYESIYLSIYIWWWLFWWWSRRSCTESIWHCHVSFEWKQRTIAKDTSMYIYISSS